VAVIALTVDRPEIGDLAIGGDAETAKRVPGMAGAMADEGERDRCEDCGEGAADVEEAIVAQAISFLWSRNRRIICLLHAVAKPHESVFAHPVWRQIVRFVEIDVVDFVAGNEGVDLQGLVALGHGRGDFVGFQNDILAVLDLVALDLLIALNGIAGFAIDELSLDAVAGLAVQRVEGNAFRRGGCGVERHRA
jgi:hypothetical protein